MIDKQIRSINLVKPKCVNDKNLAMGGVDQKDQKLQPYLRLLNVAVHNAFILYQAKNADHLIFRIGLVKAIINANRQQLGSPTARRLSINTPPWCLVERLFIERIPVSGKQAKPQRRCVVCTK
ncbi:hypothetical protein J437_LFUL017035 [Ladona fulva]|uniref:PiggyBac transposable element-derived protein domain-containing protein n=1 Tax=Ladona fulva TaxID=123851 RepID=A0A8K0KMD3_LADFU|nr:hypothetical protein J437_LFUL017035 [Ladona fulva]